jgi:hypothetical protein
MNGLEQKISKLLQEEQPMTESEAQDLAALICDLPEIKGGRVEAEVKPESGGDLFEMSIYTGRVNGSDTHQKVAQYINFVAKDKKQLEHLINLLCDRIRETNTADTHNEVLAEIIGKANRFSV